MIRCPQCSKPCHTRFRHLGGIAGGVGIGLVILFAFPFFPPVYCPDHGKLALTDFSHADRKYMRRRTMVLLVISVAILLALMGAMAWLLSR